MKTIQDCISYVTELQRTHPLPNTECMNYLRAIETYLEAYDRLLDDTNVHNLSARIDMLESEYNAYHIDNNDYWRGIRYALDVVNKK